MKNLSLSRNNIGNYGLQCISLMFWPDFQKIDISNNNISDESIPYFSACFWPKLAVINLSNFFIIST